MPGQLIARGRAADVFDAGPGRVLRRYRNPHLDSGPEAAVMQHAQRAGFPVPTVYDAAGPDLVLSRLVGPTMFELLARRPWQLGKQAELLATLHRDLAAVAAPVGLHTPLGAGTSLLHLDLHPGNVVLTPTGPVVIDWTNAAAGPAAAGVADTWLLMSSARPEGPLVARALATVLARRMVEHFVEAAGRGAARPFLPSALERRTADHNMQPAEIARMHAVAAAEAQPAA